jgi:uncharacterized membrane protein (UPF0136 family)
MKLTDKLVEKVGADRLLHFFVAAWLVSECKAFGIVAAFFGWIVVIILSAIKEHFLDDEPEPMDACAAAYGGIVSLLIGVLEGIL